MTNQKKISRREAIKLLGAAAGASLLANIPAKWSKPELTGGVLPAHAQTSCSGNAVEFTITAPAGATLFYAEIVNQVIGPSGSVSDGASVNGGIACGTGCYQVTSFFTNGSGTAEVQLNTFFGGASTVNFTGGPSYFSMLVNLATGENSFVQNTPISGCDWIIF